MASVEGYIALGSNLGDRERNLEFALEGLIGSGLEILATSSVWETEAVDSTEPLTFLNMVVRIRTEDRPVEVLALLHEIERRAGRIRQVKNEPRVLDLDLLTMGGLTAEGPGLVLPHPRMWERRFVLAPLDEIAPGLTNPATGMTVHDALDALDEQPWVRLAAPLAGPV